MSGIDIVYQYRYSMGIRDDWGIQSYKDPHQYEDLKKSVNTKKIVDKKIKDQKIQIKTNNVISNKVLPHRISYFEDIQKMSKNYPGPGQYKSLQIFKTPKNNQISKMNDKSKSINYLTNLQNQKKSIPGVGKYNILDSIFNLKKSSRSLKMNQQEQKLQKLIKQKFQKDYRYMVGPGLYNIHHKQIGKDPIKSKILPGPSNFPKINNKQQPNLNTYTPVPSYQTFQKISKKNYKSFSQSKLSKQKRFYNPQQSIIIKKPKPGPADYNLIADWGSKKNNRVKNNIFQKISKKVFSNIYH